MSDLPDKIVRFDTLKIEYGKAKMCKCHEPHYEIDYQNRLVYCEDCGAIVDPFEALVHIANNTERWSRYTEQLLEQRRQIKNYHPRRVVIKELEKRYVSADLADLIPKCPRCGKAFELEELIHCAWVNRNYVNLTE